MRRLQRHRSALVLALAIAGSSPVHARVDTGDGTTAPQAQVLRDAVADAAGQAAQGDTLGALIAFERLLASPALPTLSQADRLEAYSQAAWTALQTGQTGLARTYLQSARQLSPDEPRVLYLLGALDTQEGNPLDGIRNITRAVQLAPSFAGDVSINMAAQFIQRLQGEEDVLRAFLEVLFQRQWKPDGVEPTDFWRTLALLQINAEQSERVAATLARIDTPMEVIALRADKRFDRFIDRDSPRFDPQQSAQRHLDTLRLDTLLAPENVTALSAMSEAMLLMGKNEDVLAMTDRAAEVAAGPGIPDTFEGSGDLAWLLNSRAIAQRRLGDIETAMATMTLAGRFSEGGGSNVSQRLNLAVWQTGILQPRQALETANGIGDNLNPYGEAVQQWVRFAAYRQLGDLARAEQAKAWLQAHDDVAAGYFMEALLEDNALDAAAAHLIGRLQSTQHRSDTLLSVQRFVTVPSLPGDAERDRRWWQVVARRDVQAALNAVGRSDAYAIVARGSSR